MTVSIITITHNRAHLIGSTLQSVLAQTHADFEHIIIDDGSTDDTESVVPQFNDPRIRYYKYEKNAKRSFLRNECIRKARGEFIAIIDSDDLWTSDKLETVISIFKAHPSVDFVIHDIEFSGAQSNPITKYIQDFSGNIFNEVLKNKILPFPVFTIRKSALEAIGLLDETMIDGQHDLYLRVASKLKVYYCAKKLTTMRKHDQNISSTPDVRHYYDYLKSIEKLEKEQILPTQIALTIKSEIYSKMAYIYLTQRRIDLAKENFAKSFRSDFRHYAGLKSAVKYLKLTFIR